jgi:hydroxymethylpyrimidine/phosphomethylpyrimidine kinase
MGQAFRARDAAARVRPNGGDAIPVRGLRFRALRYARGVGIRKPLPVALTIAGSDSGGGAGIQADLHTFAALGVHGTTVITCLTAQNPAAVLGVEVASSAIVRRQLEAVFAELPPRAAKTGMLYAAGIIRAVARFFSDRDSPPLIVDPVMVASSGARLLNGAAWETLTNELLPQAALVTPNLPEAEALTGLVVRGPEQMRAAARFIVRNLGCAALIKGGHLTGGGEAVDIFYDGKTELLLRASFVKGLRTHGTGCAYSAAITAGCARGWPLPEAVTRAKQFITRAIAESRCAGRHPVLAWGSSAACR